MMRYFLGAFCILVISAGCVDRDKSGKPVDTPTSGSIQIAVDESLKPLLEAEIDTFQGIYQGTSVGATYTSEAEAIDLLLKDSVRLVVITRELTKEENDILLAQHIPVRKLVIAHEGIAFIMNQEKRDSLLSVKQIHDIFSGEISKWNQLFKGASNDSLKIVFDNPSSGILRHLKDTLDISEIPSNCFAVDNNPSVVDYVSKNKNAIGLIGVSWISDIDDSTSDVFLNTIRVVGIKIDSSYYKPYQAYIAQHKYPFSRKVFIISREARTGLGTGFTSFVASDKGQRIVLKAGLVPATMPIRIVEIKHQPLGY